jgi:hypothetical protein
MIGFIPTPIANETEWSVRSELSDKECTDQSGIITYDIGDGATHRPDYLCDGSRVPPMGTIATADCQLKGREGAVCCPGFIPTPIFNTTEWSELSDKECTDQGGTSPMILVTVPLIGLTISVMGVVYHPWGRLLHRMVNSREGKVQYAAPVSFLRPFQQNGMVD